MPNQELKRTFSIFIQDKLNEGSYWINGGSIRSDLNLSWPDFIELIKEKEKHNILTTFWYVLCPNCGSYQLFGADDKNQGFVHCDDDDEQISIDEHSQVQMRIYPNLEKFDTTNFKKKHNQTFNLCI
ncbi:MAG: hypothetical protein HeimC2_28290 [Candidatus Heimdallarchaeota archaeon LC_2]|nr:MAG: hypothetical protein HeimC2_28290 [Candidatus Heimdallarchaeota archaeon LC_2]